MTQGRLGRGNTKLGNSILTYSRLEGPAAEVENGTCPGASDWCFKNCYAHRLGRYPNVKQAWTDNALADELPLLPDRGTIRIHVAGDFDTAPYIRQWIAALKARPNLQAFAFTRSWRVPRLRKALEELRALPNVQLFASMDPTMPDPPEGWRVAWVDDPKLEDWRINPEEAVTCPNQVSDGAINCETCRYCIREPKNAKQDVVFLAH